MADEVQKALGGMKQAFAKWAGIDAATGGDPFGVPQQGPDINSIVQQAVQQAMATQGGGAGGQAGLKPKIDVNVEIAQIKNLLAKVIDHLGIPVPAQQMSITSQDLNSMAANPGATPQAGGPQGPIAPVDPMAGAQLGGGGAMPPAKQAELAGYLKKAAQAIMVIRQRNASVAA